ncbi:hypothetical protein G9A89_022256 [Geosiphon pyriformis]|nr:hypothetical protein G9A89_022256 [Geosiphon pyriformis]
MSVSKAPISPDPYEATDTKKFKKWRQSLKYFTGLGLTPDEKAEIEAEREKDLEKSPIVVFMLQRLEQAGCKIERNHFRCLPCDATRTGGFSPGHGILLCQNRFYGKSHQQDTMVHEMIHLYDHCRFKVDWNNCLHHACSEVRAASLSGDCRWLREIQRGHFTNFGKQHQNCVRRRAVLSVSQNASCSAPGVAAKAVGQVFESCFKDTRPFDEIY